jgi:undecaprenyl-diphosphatase
VTLPSIWALILVVIGLFFLHEGRQDIAPLNAIVAACIPISTVLKLIVRRERPKTVYATNMKIKSYSFPSSHAYAATLAGGYLALLSLMLLPTPMSLLFAGTCFILIIAIGMSRIHIGAHYPTDVTAGWLLGIVVLSLIAHYSVL